MSFVVPALASGPLPLAVADLSGSVLMSGTAVLERRGPACVITPVSHAVDTRAAAPVVALYDRSDRSSWLCAATEFVWLAPPRWDAAALRHCRPVQLDDCASLRTTAAAPR